MAFNGQTKCAVPNCTEPCSGSANLCEEHRAPGMGIAGEGGTGVVTVWYAEHCDECGLILLNDWALGAQFGGMEGFKAKLELQGFTNVRNLPTPEEFDAARALTVDSRVGWSGPWRTEYPWEMTSKAR